jgi:hypothetical protein
MLDGAVRYKVDRLAENRLKVLLETHKRDEADEAVLKLNENIDIAFQASLVTGDGTEERQ